MTSGLITPVLSGHKNKQDAVRIIQINMDRNRTTSDLMLKYAKKENVDIAIFAEPNKKAAVAQGWYVDLRLDAAIAVLSRIPAVQNYDRGLGYV